MLSSILILWDSLLNLISELPKAVVARSEGMVHANAATAAHFLVAVYVMMPPRLLPRSVSVSIPLHVVTEWYRGARALWLVGVLLGDVNRGYPTLYMIRIASFCLSSVWFRALSIRQPTRGDHDQRATGAAPPHVS